MMSLENRRKVLNSNLGLHSNLESNLDSKMRTVKSTKTNNLWDIPEIRDNYKVSLVNHLVSNKTEDITLIKETKTSHNIKFQNNFQLHSMTI